MLLPWFVVQRGKGLIISENRRVPTMLPLAIPAADRDDPRSPPGLVLGVLVVLSPLSSRPLPSATRSVPRLVASALVAALAGGFSLMPNAAALGQTPPDAPPAAPAASPASDAARIAELEAKLAEALARIAQLEAELAAAKAGQQAGQQAGQPTGQQGAPSNPGDSAASPTTPANPDAADEASEAQAIKSVDQFFHLVKTEYAVAFPAPEAGQRPESGPAFKRSIERFAISMNRAWRQQIRWTVTLRKAVRGPEGTLLTVQPLRADGTPLGEEIPMRVDTIRNRRLDAILQKARMNDTYVINGLFIPKITANADRMTEGVFNNPPFVGPGIEFRYEITVDGLALVKEPLAAEPTAPAAPGAPTSR